MLATLDFGVSGCFHGMAVISEWISDPGNQVVCES